MINLLLELRGWFAFLQRPAVLLQLGLITALVVAVLQCRRLPPQRPWRWLQTLPLSLTLLPGQGLIALLLAAGGQRNGLVLLGARICLVWFVLQLLETRVLAHWLPAQSRHMFVSRLLRPAFLVWVLLALLDALGSLQDIASASLGTWFGSEISLGRLFSVLAVLYLLLVGLGLPSQWVSRLLQQSLKLSDGSRRALDQILRYVLMSLGLVWAVTSLGINQTGLLAVAGGLSVGLGFGIKEVFSNIVSGLWLLIEGSVRPGEVLMHGGDVCEVRRLGPRATTLLRGIDNAELMVPNQDFFTTATVTYTRSDRRRRCTVDVSVPRRWPPGQIVALLLQIAQEHPLILSQPPPSAQLQAFGPRFYSYRLAFSVPDPMLAAGVSAELRLEICRCFQQHGIDPPA